MKEALAAAMAGLVGLGSTDDGRERPVDRLGALGMAQSSRGHEAMRESFMVSLGRDLIAFKYGNQAASREFAEDKLAILLKEFGRLNAAKRDKIARVAIHEWALDFCPRCSGAGQIPDHACVEGAQPMKTCPECSGTGKRRYSDLERAEALGEPFAKAMEEAHRLIGWAEGLAVRRVKEMLERW